MAKKQDFDKDIHLSSFDDLFQTDESREDMKREKLMDIPISKIQDFPDHPYKVKDDENMVELVESIKTRGLIQPVLVRPIDNGMYEMVSGHRRKRAFEIAGIEKIPARVQNLTKDEAILSMVDSNLQRDEILPSEKAFAFKMRLEAMKRQAGRPSKNSVPLAQNFEGKTSREILGEQVGESQDQIRRYIRLTNLIPEMLDLVDEKKIAMRPAVEISYLTPEEQMMIFEIYESDEVTPSLAQAQKMRKLSEQNQLNADTVLAILTAPKPNQAEAIKIPEERINKFFGKNYTKQQKEEHILKALEYYHKHLQRQRNRDAR